MPFGTIFVPLYGALTRNGEQFISFLFAAIFNTFEDLLQLLTK